MPRLRRKAATRSEHHGAKRGRQRAIPLGERQAVVDARYGRCGESVRATAMTRRADLDASLRGEANRRRAAMRLGKASGRAVGDGSGATEPRRREGEVLLSGPASEARSERQMEAERPSHGGGKARSCCLDRQAKRAASDSERRRQGSSPEGRRPRSGLRGAGRGEAAPGGIEPGNRSEGPGGRPYFLVGQANYNESLTSWDGDG